MGNFTFINTPVKGVDSSRVFEHTWPDLFLVGCSMTSDRLSGVGAWKHFSFISLGKKKDLPEVGKTVRLPSEGFRTENEKGKNGNYCKNPLLV